MSSGDTIDVVFLANVVNFIPTPAPMQPDAMLYNQLPSTAPVGSILYMLLLSISCVLGVGNAFSVDASSSTLLNRLRSLGLALRYAISNG